MERARRSHAAPWHRQAHAVRSVQHEAADEGAQGLEGPDCAEILVNAGPDGQRVGRVTERRPDPVDFDAESLELHEPAGLGRAKSCEREKGRRVELQVEAIGPAGTREVPREEF